MRKGWLSLSFNTRKEMLIVLAVCWFSGLLCGIFYFSVCDNSVISLMHRMVFCSASIVGLLSASFIPFLLTSFFVATSRIWAVFLVSFVKAFLFSFVSIGCLTTFGSGGWLLRYFLLFCDCAVLPAFFWYCMRYITAPVRTRWIAATIAFAGVIALITVLDYRIIAPLVCLIDSMKG